MTSLHKYWVWFKSGTYYKVALLGTGNILNAGMGFLYILAVAKSLGVEDFGKYVLLAGILVSTAKLLDFGTNSLFVAKTIKNSMADTKPEIESFINSKVYLFFISLGVSYTAIAYFRLINVTTILLTTLGIIGYLIYYILYGIFHKNENFQMLLLLNFIPGSIKGLFGALILLNFIELSYLGYFFVFIIAIFSILAIYPQANIPGIFVKPNFTNFASKIKESYMAGMSQFINESWPSINSGLIKNFLSFSNVAVYSIADKMSDVFSLLSLAIFTVLLPKNARNKGRNTKYNFNEVLLLTTVIMFLAVVCYLGSVYVINNFLDGEYRKSIGLLGVLIFNSAIMAVTAFMEHHFYVEEKPKYLLVTNSVRLATLLTLSWLLLPSLGILGLAISNIVSTTLGFLLIAVFVRKINVY